MPNRPRHNHLRRDRSHPKRERLSPSCTGRGIGRQGMGSFSKQLLRFSTICPVVLCPYLCTSDSRAPGRSDELCITVLYKRAFKQTETEQCTGGRRGGRARRRRRPGEAGAGPRPRRRHEPAAAGRQRGASELHLEGAVASLPRSAASPASAAAFIRSLIDSLIGSLVVRNDGHPPKSRGCLGSPRAGSKEVEIVFLKQTHIYIYIYIYIY